MPCYMIAQSRDSLFVGCALKMIDCWMSYCIQMEAKVVLSKLLQNFTISLPEDYKLVPVARATTQPKDNVPCTLECRKNELNIQK